MFILYFYNILYRGVAYSKPAYQVPLAARTARGVPLPQVLPIGTAESVTSVIPVASFTSTTTEEVHLVLLTDRGFMKKTPLKAFEAISNRGLQIISLESGDALKWARLCTESDEVLVATRLVDSLYCTDIVIMLLCVCSIDDEM